jgi:hypothetical protein
MAGALRKLLSLSLAEHVLLVQAAVALPLTRRSLKVRGFTATARSLERLARRRLALPLRGDEAARAAVTARIVYAAGARFPFRANCLPKALVLRTLLLRQRIAADLRIGVRIVDGRLEGHAWVEHDGEPLSQPAAIADRFAPFPGDLAAVRQWDR